MSSHAEILGQRQSLTRPFWTSVFLHLSVLAAFLATAWIEHGSHLLMGSATGGGFGSVMVNPVATIPLPNPGGPVNPVANPTQSQVPTPPKEAPKATPKIKLPPPNAIALKSDKATPKRPSEALEPPNKFRDQQKFDQSQLYSTAGQRINSPMFEKPGAGGVGVGDSSIFGTQFGAYATLVRDQVGRNWRTVDIDPHRSTAPPVVITFTINHDGSVANSSVKVRQSSGIAPLDISAQRAIYDANPFPPLPPGFPKSTADVELRFELRR